MVRTKRVPLIRNKILRKKVLKLRKEGFFLKQIAEKMGISIETVRFILDPEYYRRMYELQVINYYQDPSKRLATNLRYVNKNKMLNSEIINHIDDRIKRNLAVKKRLEAISN